MFDDVYDPFSCPTCETQGEQTSGESLTEFSRWMHESKTRTEWKCPECGEKWAVISVRTSGDEFDPFAEEDHEVIEL